jgi:hypothetical protein
MRIREARNSRYFFLISAAIVKKACSTLMESLALVSRKGIPSSSANACGS